MVEINEWLLETLYALKKLYDHGKADELLAEYEDEKLSGEDIGDISMRGVCEVFENTRSYWDEWSGEDIYVFFDPIFNEFYGLCDAYEERIGVSRDRNPHRKEIERAIEVGLHFNDYSYGYHVYDGSQRDGSCKIILKLYPEFCSMYEVAGGLLEVYDAYASHIKRLKKELGMEEETKIIALPAVQAETKEAA
ncbi:MAG: hypothetical protein IJV43_08535 [Oscillospiraceae bacterium]|nr:hypothetical protein [Oscillospiraceae bacterium]